MRKIISLMVVAALSTVILASLSVANTGFGNLKFPTIEIHMLDGKNMTITDTIWKGEIFPIFFTSTISKYNWSSDPNYKYVFFDYNLSALNTFGAEFVFELEQYSNITLKTITDALLKAVELPSLITGYTNGQLLNLGILPGFANSTIPQKPIIGYNIPWQDVVLIILIISAIVVYYIFKPKND
ncbi:MAG: hypothetical protein ACP5RZ_00455 [Thermoplasmata archaeon]